MGSTGLVTAIIAAFAIAIISALAIAIVTALAIIGRSTTTNHLCRQEDTRYFR